MEVKPVHIRHCLLFDFDLAVSATQAHRHLRQTEGRDDPSLNTCHDWYNRFRSGERILEVRPMSGRPSEVDLDALLRLSLVEADPRATRRSLAATLLCSNAAIDNHLHSIGKTHAKRYKISFLEKEDLVELPRKSAAVDDRRMITSSRKCSRTHSTVLSPIQSLFCVNDIWGLSWPPTVFCASGYRILGEAFSIEASTFLIFFDDPIMQRGSSMPLIRATVKVLFLLDLLSIIVCGAVGGHCSTDWQSVEKQLDNEAGRGAFKCLLQPETHCGLNCQGIFMNQTFSLVIEADGCLHPPGISINVTIPSIRLISYKQTYQESSRQPIPYAYYSSKKQAIPCDDEVRRCNVTELFKCLQYETCIPLSKDGSEGECKCLLPYTVNEKGECAVVPTKPLPTTTSPLPPSAPTTPGSSTSSTNSGGILAGVFVPLLLLVLGACAFTLYRKGFCPRLRAPAGAMTLVEDPMRRGDDDDVPPVT
ncbi:unnamed protein product [Darwinula stevensoni]|uniref:Mos1 transposase HTH domain-containing protein n=1 Tax=Darwinula stevensoni TaxID=69355 RepID=A0A7R8XML3_9CRUS|nr:unnamed protein product [Darwinula stevensoni]CAG0895755.1 unnamed protein product [Darwinula stevensoni]